MGSCGKGSSLGCCYRWPAMACRASCCSASCTVLSGKRCRLCSRLSSWTDHPGHLRAPVGPPRDRILVGSRDIRVVSGRATMVDIPSALETGKPLDPLQRGRMDADRSGMAQRREGWYRVRHRDRTWPCVARAISPVLPGHRWALKGQLRRSNLFTPLTRRSSRPASLAAEQRVGRGHCNTGGL